MAKYSKFNIVYQLQKWMDSVAGQTFLNYAYSWGASIVILGTLFKLTHLPSANFFLFLGVRLAARHDRRHGSDGRRRERYGGSRCPGEGQQAFSCTGS